eukprot:g2065.t1 g2065   contig11:642599-643740(+)
MAPRQPSSSASLNDGNTVSRIYLIRHGDRFDYANPQWLETARENGALVTDPPLSALGHRQARETADYLAKITKKHTESNGTNDDESTTSGGAQDSGLSEAHATPDTPDKQVLPSAKDRFAYFPEVDSTHSSILNVTATPGFICPKTGYPCEAFAGKYCQRLEQFARLLEQEYHGKTIVCFSHAASVALVAALLKCSMRELKFAPCGVYELQRVNSGKWTMVQSGESNEDYVSENSSTTYPWGFSETHFMEREDVEKGEGYFGSSEGIDLDYFVQSGASSSL